MSIYLAGQAIQSPPALTADTDDWGPDGSANANTLLISSTTDVELRGLAGGAPKRELRLVNEGSNDITLIANAGTSTSANRFKLADDTTLIPGQAVDLLYSDSISGWVSGSSAPGLADAVTDLTALVATSGLRFPYLRATGGALSAAIQAAFDAGVLAVGQVIETAAYWQGGGLGGAKYLVVAAATGTEDGGSFIDGTGFQLQAVFDGAVDVFTFGLEIDPGAAGTALTYLASIGGGALLFPAGTECTVDGLLWDPADGPLTIHAAGAVVNYSGAGVMLDIQPTATRTSNIGPIVSGGWWIGTASASHAFRAADTNGCQWSNVRCTGFTAGVIWELQLKESWMENTIITDCRVSGFARIMRFSGVAANAGGGSSASFARTRVRGLVASSVGATGCDYWFVTDTDTAVYDSEFSGIGGNLGSTTEAVFYLAGNMGWTAIEKIKLERNSGTGFTGETAVFRWGTFTANGPTIRDVRKATEMPYEHSGSGASRMVPFNTYRGLEVVGETGVAKHTFRDDGIGLFGKTKVGQGPAIANAGSVLNMAGSLDTLLSYLRARGDIQTDEEDEAAALIAEAAHYWVPQAGPAFVDMNGGIDGIITGATYLTQGASYSDQSSTSRTASRNSLWLAGSGNDIQIPSGAAPILDDEDGFTFIVFGRVWSPGSNTNAVLYTNKNGTAAGITLRGSGASWTGTAADLGDGTTSTTSPSLAATFAANTIFGVLANPASGGGTFQVINNGSLGTTAARPSGDQSPGAVTSVIGANFARNNNRLYLELHAAAQWARALTSAEVTALATMATSGVLPHTGTLAAYTPTNDSTDRAFDASTVTLPELANVVATLIRDLGLV